MSSSSRTEKSMQRLKLIYLRNVYIQRRLVDSINTSIVLQGVDLKHRKL